MNSLRPALFALFAAALALPASAGAGAGLPTSAPLAESSGRVIVLGFDGADGRTAEEMMERGELPNLRKLREQGTFARLGTSAPAESPASWACLNTGQNPGKTGVPGFVVNTGKLAGKEPRAGFGHIEVRKGETAVPIDEIGGLPFPAWSPAALGGAAFGAAFLAFLFVFGVLLKIRTMPALVFSLLLGLVGGWGGYTVRGYLPARFPRVENPNQARNLWDFAADAGVRSIVIDAVQAWDMPTPEGARVLAGLGVPDARMGLGEWFVYTADEFEYDAWEPKGRSGGSAGTLFRVEAKGGVIDSKIYGPVNFWEEEPLRRELEKLTRSYENAGGYEEGQKLKAELDEVSRKVKDPETYGRATVDLRVELRPTEAEITIDGVAQTLKEGEWSDWFSLTFALNPLLKVHAVTRCKILHLSEPHFELYVDKLDIDPRKPPFWQPISQPPGFAAELAKDLGKPYETYGWSTMTMPFKEDRIEPEVLLEDVEFTFGWREELIYKALQRDDWQLLMSVEGTTDRVQHMMYQYYDAGHPLYDAQVAERKAKFFGKEIPLSEAVPEIYRQVDRMVGTVMERYLGPDDTLIVCSDHGFQSFRYQFHVNNWLAEKGYLTVRDGLSSRGHFGSPASYADWSKTQAFCMGLGFIYLNVEGREPDGIVRPSEVDALVKRIKQDLLEVVDPERGAPVITDVYVTKEIHKGGAFREKEPELIIGCAPNYRVSWATSGGGMSVDSDLNLRGIVQDNTSPWSGGHVSVDIEAVRGIFFSNRRFALPESGPDLLHVAPTVLSLLGVDVPPEMDVAALERR